MNQLPYGRDKTRKQLLQAALQQRKSKQAKQAKLAAAKKISING